MSKRADLKPSTVTAQAMGACDPTTRAIVPPLVASAHYERSPDGSYPGGHSYTRDQNPTYKPCEKLLAHLEKGHEALLFSSGMAAAVTVFENLPFGAHVVIPEYMYWTLRLWLEEMSRKGRFVLDSSPNGDLDALREVIRPGITKIVWVETPSNPTCAITDICGTVEVAHQAGARVVVDGTVATPVLSRPLELGADMVMHSATKQLNGHSDVLAGVLITACDDEDWDSIKRDRYVRGAVIGPFEAWLLLRGLRTLFLRVTKASETAQQIAEMLVEMPNVKKMFYPGLALHPGHDVALRQMHGGFGPIVSFCVDGYNEASRVVQALQVFRNATSLGGVESLVEHRAQVEGLHTNVPEDLVRLSIGIEDVDDLATDLKQALTN